MAAPYRQKTPNEAVDGGPNVESAKIDPTRAAAGVARWRRLLSETLGQDPGPRLDEPRFYLAMLKVFGSTKRLADTCLKHPTFASQGLLDGPSSILAEAARDLTALNNGVGGAEALHGALAPIKTRADIAISLAEISNVWTTAQANTARSDLAERLVETALCWLIRGAIARGELSIPIEGNVANGVFALAGGDFAHEDLAPLGPLDILVIYDQSQFQGSQIPMAERAFIRIGSELREAFEGRPGEFSVFNIRTPMGSGVNGAGIVESVARMEAAFADPQANSVRRWAATARVVAGDRTSGGAFLEDAEEALWSDDPVLGEMTRENLQACVDDPRERFRTIANLLRWSLGKTRPIFRIASTNDVFATAASSSILPLDVADRLCAGNDFAQMLVSRSQTIKGTASFGPSSADEEAAIASLCGFDDFAHLSCVRDGALAEARNGISRILVGAKSEFERYATVSQIVDDIDKLEDLGFRDGEKLSGVVDGWAALCREGGDQRFSAIAPGLLTAFGETQRPDRAVRLFDRMLTTLNNNSEDKKRTFSPLQANDGLVDAIGCFGMAVAPLMENASIISELFEERGSETPSNAQEWIARFPAPRLTDTIDAFQQWREELIARVAFLAATRDISFSVASEALAAIHRTTLCSIFEIIRTKADVAIALHIFSDSRFGLPGAPTSLGFTADKKCEQNEAVVREFLQVLVDLGSGIFSIAPDVSHRPGGVAGALAPDAAEIRSYIQSEAVANDQIMLARAEVIAGPEDCVNEAKAALRTAVANPRRADVLFRDIDRARAQRLRRDKAGSEWDIDVLEGGPLDVDLIISTLIYRHAAALPSIQTLSVDDALDLMVRSDLIVQPVAETLKAARGFWARLGTLRALAQWNDPQTSPVRKRFAKMVANAAEVENFGQVRPIKRGYADEITRLYAQFILGRPSLGLVANG